MLWHLAASRRISSQGRSHWDSMMSDKLRHAPDGADGEPEEIAHAIVWLL
jgi:hypothetical protein